MYMRYGGRPAPPEAAYVCAHARGPCPDTGASFGAACERKVFRAGAAPSAERTAQRYSVAAAASHRNVPRPSQYW